MKGRHSDKRLHRQRVYDSERRWRPSPRSSSTSGGGDGLLFAYTQLPKWQLKGSLVATPPRGEGSSSSLQSLEGS